MYGDFFSFYLCDLVLKLNGKGRPAGVRQGRRADYGTVRAEMKSFAERNPLDHRRRRCRADSAVMVRGRAATTTSCPFVNQGKHYSAYFAEAGGLHTGAAVQVSGYPGGQGVQHRARRARACWSNSMSTRTSHLGDRTEAAIKTKSLLGARSWKSSPRGDARAVGTDPDRPHDVALPIARRPRRFGHHHQRTEHRPAVATRWPRWRKPSPGHPAGSEGRRATGWRASRRHSTTATPNCATCWPTPTKPPTVLAERTDQVVGLVPTPTRCWPSCRPKAVRWTRSRANISALVAAAVRDSSPRTATQLQPRAGQAQRGAGDRRQPQGARTAGDQAAQQLRDVAR